MGNENSRGRKPSHSRDSSANYGNSDSPRSRNGSQNYTSCSTSDSLEIRLPPPAPSGNVGQIFTAEYVSGALALASGAGDKNIRAKYLDDEEPNNSSSSAHSAEQISKASLDKPVGKVSKENEVESYDELSQIFMGVLTVKEDQEFVPTAGNNNADAGDKGQQDMRSFKVNRFEPQQVHIGQIIGEGGFGRVFKATLNGATNVASKLILAPFIVTEELNQLLTLKHKNFATVIGVVRQTSEMDPPQLLLQYYPEGNLLQYLNRHYTPKDNGMLGKFAFDISEGCQFLHKCNVVHGNLAARNILVEKIAKNNKTYYNAKISDIGLIRFAEPSGVNYVKVPKVVPLRWVPKEIVDGSCDDFTFSSDVWGFGVVLWEMWSKGAIPYGATYSNPRIIQFLNEDYSPLKIHRPAGCPKHIVAIMESTFQVDPLERPTFTELLVKLQHYKGLGIVTKSGADAGGGAAAKTSQSGKPLLVDGAMGQDSKEAPENFKLGEKAPKKRREKPKKQAAATTNSSTPSEVSQSTADAAAVDQNSKAPETDVKPPKSQSNQKPPKNQDNSVDSAAAEVEALRKKVAQLEKEKRGGGGRGNLGARGRGAPGQEKRGGPKPKFNRGAASRGVGNFPISAGNPYFDRGEAASPSPHFHAPPPPPYSEKPLPYHSNPHLPAQLPAYDFGQQAGRGGHGGYFGGGRQGGRSDAASTPGGKEEDTAAKMKRLEQEMALLQAEKRIQEATQLMKLAAGADGTGESGRAGVPAALGSNFSVSLSNLTLPHQVDFGSEAGQYPTEDVYGGAHGAAPYAGPGGHRGSRGLGRGRAHHQWRPYYKGSRGGRARGRGAHQDEGH